MDEKDFGHFKSYLEDEIQLGSRTIGEYLYVYRNFNPMELSQEYINAFVLRYKNTTIVRSFIKHYLAYQGISELFTLPQKPKGRKQQKVVRSITNDELKLIREYFYNSSFKHGLLLDMIYQGAMRRVEVLTITLGSFFWNEWFANISDFCKLIILGKGKKQRIVLINSETAQSIIDFYIKKYDLESMDRVLEFLTDNRDALLFAKADGKPLIEKDVYRTIKSLSMKALGRDIRPHELRHSRATELEKKGIPLRDIRNYLGHTKLATTEIYLHKTGEESTETIKEALR